MAERKVTVTDNQELAEEIGADESVNIQVDEVEQPEEEKVETSIQIEDVPDEELLWENGPTAKTVKEWKKMHGEIYVTSITFDKHIVWRVLNRLEYKNLVKKMEQLVQAGQLSSAEANMWNEEAIAELCMLYPKLDKLDMSGVMAGVPSLISQEVLEASGFVALEVRQL
jgi:hypothetical protein